jgi:hypothetical protein
VNTPNPTPWWHRLPDRIPLYVTMVLSLVAFFAGGTTFKFVLQSPPTKTVTVPTPAATVTVTAPAEPPPPAGSHWLSEVSNPSKNNFEEVKDYQVTIGGHTYANTVQLIHANNNCNSPSATSTVSFPVPIGATRLSGMFGWTPESNGSSATLTIYGEGVRRKLLWSAPFPNPGLPLVQKNLDNIAGLRSVTFELAGEQCDNGTFVLAEAQFTS